MSKDEFVNSKLTGILNLKKPDTKIHINKVKQRYLMLSPTVYAGLERECKMSDFDIDKKSIGKGGFGQVWKVVHKQTQKVYCIKTIPKKNIIQQKLVDQMNREIEIMYLLNHPHCLRLKNHFEDDENFYLLMPLAVKGQLYKYLKRQKKFDERTTAQILRETISALQCLHSFKPPIIHRDIKPENLLLNEQDRILLADYGWSNFKNDDDVRKTFCGTPEYIAPEMLNKKGHDQSVDIWSIGVLMFELLAGYSPFVARNNQDLYANIRALKIRWPNDMTPTAKNLITKILKLNPKERPTLDEILNHQWFKNIKMIKPLLTNTIKTESDILIYHMVSTVTDKVIKNLNALLKLSGEKAQNLEKSKLITAEIQDNVNLVKKNNIVNQIHQQKKIAGNQTIINEGSGTFINLTKEQIDNLNLQNASLTKDNANLNSKILSLETENKNLKNENQKLKENDTTSLQEQIKKLNSEIEKYKIKEKERINLLLDLDEKNKIIIDLNAKIQLMENDKIQIEKQIENLKKEINDVNNKLEIKTVTIEELNKKNDKISKEKEDLFIEYQKKIETLNNKVFESSNDSSLESAMKLISLLNENMNEFKEIFKKKIDNFNDNFNLFKKEYNLKGDKINNLLNDKSKIVLDLINKFNSNLSNDVTKVFEKVNQPSPAINGKIEWYAQQNKELSEYKIKHLEMERKNNELQNKIDNLNLTIKQLQDEKIPQEKNYNLKSDLLNKLKVDCQNKDSQINDIKNYLKQNLKKEQFSKFNEYFNEKYK